MPKTKRFSRFWKIFLILIAAVVLLGVLATTTGLFGGGETGTAVEVQEADRRDITQVVTAFGRVQPEVEVKISPDVSGEIVELHVREGDHVQQGDLLASIRPDFYAAQLEQAEAGLKQAQATLAQRRADLLQAESQFQRQQELYENDVIPGSELEQARTAYEVAQAAYEAAEYSVESAQARQREARDELSKTRIYAPMDGTVSMLEVELGERVVGTSQMEGTEMMRIARLDQMELEVDVNENDVVNVSLEDTARVEVDAYPGQGFRGVVTEIANSARVSGQGTQEQVTNFPVKVRLLEAHNLDMRQAAPVDDAVAAAEEQALPEPGSPVFRPGMSGAVDIFTRHATDAVAVPIQAVSVRDVSRSNGEEGAGDHGEEELRQVVFVMEDDGQARMVEVETGISDDTHIEIQSGLAGGERVITGPYRAVSRELHDGAPVRESSRTPRPAS